MKGRSPMTRQLVVFLALLFNALALVPTMAHLSELPNKIELTREQYLTVQQIYRGWALFGIAALGALLSNLALALTARGRRKVFGLALFAFLCIVGTQIVFWTLTQPVNAATDNWMRLPADWQAARRQWEYSHAASAVLNLGAFVAVALVAVIDRNHNTRGHG